MQNLSAKEQRIRKITNLYYSRPEIQKAIFDFSKNREVAPSFMMESFGKRPDSFEYPGDIFQMVKKGATSFHCSEELWSQPLNISTDMNEKQLNELRTGWDLLLDIDSKYIDYSKIYAKIIINFLKFSGVKNIGIKFSGSKGFHIIVPWKAFPKEINEIKTSDMFPEWARIVTRYIMEKTKPKLIEEITKLTTPNKYIRDFQAPKEVMPDLILVSPRHLFRMPYSLHEKTALASIVLDENELENFDMKDTNPMKLSKEKIKNFMPDSKENEASELLMQALDWEKETSPKEAPKNFEFKAIKINDKSEKNFPPCIQKILLGLKDGRKRAVFALINFLRSIEIEKDMMENIIYSWNKKNQPLLKEGYIKSQISWALKRKPVLPPNCAEFYKNMGVCFPDNLCKLIKNPINYVVKKNFQMNNQPKNKDNFKNNN
jgi:DNA primase catalytic subunit